MKVGHSTHQRLVLRQDLPFSEAKLAVSQISVDGGKVRLRAERSRLVQGFQSLSCLNALVETT